MRILFLAPQPFFQERGTTIAIDLLLGTLAQRGDSVDVLTFHLGEDRHYPNVRTFRVAPPLPPSSISPGFSWGKVYCDLFLFSDAVKMIRRTRYDLIYAVEEAAFMAMPLSRYARVPYVFDRDSSMSDQLIERFRWARPIAALLRRLEWLPMRGALAVVPMCEHLAEEARLQREGGVHVLKDVSLLNERETEAAEDLHRMLHIDGPLLLYVGNLETYQGIDLMLDAMAVLRRRHPNAHLVIIGGSDVDIRRYEQKAAELGMAHRVHLIGPRPLRALRHYLQQADLLLSPRISGCNTPMKIYSYLDSGVPVVATALTTHTQVLTSRVAALAPPEPAAMAAAITRLLNDPEERVRLALRARALVRCEHSKDAYRRSAHAVFDEIERRLCRSGTAARQRLPVEP